MLQIIALAFALFAGNDSCHKDGSWTVCYDEGRATFLHDDAYEGQQPMVIAQDSVVIWMSDKFELQPSPGSKDVVYKASMVGDAQDDGAILVINARGKIKDLYCW